MAEEPFKNREELKARIKLCGVLLVHFLDFYFL